MSRWRCKHCQTIVDNRIISVQCPECGGTEGCSEWLTLDPTESELLFAQQENRRLNQVNKTLLTNNISLKHKYIESLEILIQNNIELTDRQIKDFKKFVLDEMDKLIKD